MQIQMQSIGSVRSPYTRDGERIPRREIVADIVVEATLEPALRGIEDWSHLFVLFWMHALRDGSPRLTTHPRHRSDLPEVGVLAARGRERPNPVGLAVVELLQRDGCVLRVRGLDAYDGTPVLDIKPYDNYDVIGGCAHQYGGSRSLPPALSNRNRPAFPVIEPIMKAACPGSWFGIAMTPAVVHRALKVALVVGTLLALINHGDALLQGTVGTHTLWQILLTYVVPYCVSTFSTVQALRQIAAQAVNSTN